LTGIVRNSARLLLVIAAVISCGGEPTAPLDGRVDLTAEWETADAAALGMDPVTLTAALDHGATLPQLLSLVVVRRGRIVAEQYYHGNHVDSLNDVRSVTKTVVATIAGIVAREGKLHEDSTIGSRLSAWAPGLDAAHRAITVASLLSMSAGFQWNESSTAGYNAWITSSDPIAYVLDKPLANLPGTTFTYNSGAVHVLSVLVEKYAGRRIDQIATEKLWPRLGIQKVRWEIFPHDGRPNGGAGLDLRPRDMAKLGWLWLEEGRGRDGPVIDESWVEKGTSPAFSWWQAGAPFNQQNYGWLWWLYRKDGRTAFYAWGHGGQFIWVDPSLELVVVVTNNWRNVAAADASESARTGMDLIINHVIPAIR
jgi:CubicO group peptidase (beta-lactamase class C family)